MKQIIPPRKIAVKGKNWKNFDLSPPPRKSGLNVKTLYIEDLNLEEVEMKPVRNSLPKIYFSLRFDPGFSLAAIESLKKSGLEKIQYIDFRVENRVYYK